MEPASTCFTMFVCCKKTDSMNKLEADISSKYLTFSGWGEIHNINNGILSTTVQYRRERSVHCKYSIQNSPAHRLLDAESRLKPLFWTVWVTVGPALMAQTEGGLWRWIQGWNHRDTLLASSGPLTRSLTLRSDTFTSLKTTPDPGEVKYLCLTLCSWLSKQNGAVSAAEF